MGRIALNRNELKYLVIIAMIIDHVAWDYFPDDDIIGQGMHFVGRLTAPTMSFFIAEGYVYTRDVKKYLLRLGAFAVISWVPYSLYSTDAITLENSVITSLFLGLLAIYLWGHLNCRAGKVLTAIGLTGLSVFCDWPFFAVLWCLIFFIYRDAPVKKWVAYSLVSMLCCLMLGVESFMSGGPLFVFYSLGVFVVPFLLQNFYNGENGSRHIFHKWFFYIFYPGHLLLLYAIRNCCS